MLPVRYVSFNKASFCVSWVSWRSYDRYKVVVNLATHSVGDITVFNTVVPVSVSLKRCCHVLLYGHCDQVK